MEGVLYYQDLLYILEIIKSELISRYYHDPLASHFGIDKTKELVVR